MCGVGQSHARAHIHIQAQRFFLCKECISYRRRLVGSLFKKKSIDLLFKLRNKKGNDGNRKEEKSKHLPCLRQSSPAVSFFIRTRDAEELNQKKSGLNVRDNRFGEVGKDTMVQYQKQCGNRYMTFCTEFHEHSVQNFCF